MTSWPIRILHTLGGLRRRVLLHRRGLAALAAALAVFATVRAVAAPAEPTVTVWTAAHSVPAGAVLGRSDLRRTEHLADTVPAGAVRAPRDVLGRVAAAPLARGQVLTAGAVVGDGWLAGHPGLSAVPVRLTDPGVADLVRPGDHVDLVAADPQSPGRATVLAPDALVLAVPEEAGRMSASSLPGRLVLLGVPGALADTVVARGASMFLSVVWSG